METSDRLKLTGVGFVIGSILTIIILMLGRLEWLITPPDFASSIDPTIVGALIGGISTIVSALIGYLAVRQREQKNKALTAEVEKLRAKSHRVPMLTPEEYGIDIVAPAEYAKKGNSFAVSGTYESLPPDQRIWLSTFRVGEDGNIAEYWPQGAAQALMVSGMGMCIISVAERDKLKSF
jgi:hypothetical protein